MKPSARNLIAIFLIALTGLVVYLPALGAPFHLDDSVSVRDNAAIRSPVDLRAVWDFWPTRFITYLSLAGTFRVSGLSPLPYHLGNILVHIANGLIIFYLFRRLFPDSGPVPLVGALVFVCHPIQTQAVTYVTQRATSLAALFYLLSVLLYLSFRARPAGARRSPAYLASLASCVCAMFTKEFAITLPLMLLLVEFLAVRDGKTKVLRRLAFLLPFLLTMLVIPIIVVLHSDNPYYNDSGQIELLRTAGLVETIAPGHAGSHPLYLLAQPRAVLTYIRLVLLPVGQRVEYDTSGWSSSPIIPFAFSASLIAAVLALAWLGRRRAPLASLGVFWFGLALLPESGAVPIIDVVVEHRLYLPLVGAVLLFSSFLSSRDRYRPTCLLLAVIVIACLAVLGYHRNTVWRNPVTLWKDNAAKAPGRARVRGNLGKAYLDAGRHGEATAEFRKMIELDPTFAGAYNNLAVIQIDHLKDYDEAEKYISAAIRLFPDYPAPHVNRGVIYLNTRRIGPAVKCFEKALALDPDNLPAHRNLAACYINLGDPDRARDYLERALARWPEDPGCRALLKRAR